VEGAFYEVRFFVSLTPRVCASSRLHVLCNLDPPWIKQQRRNTLSKLRGAKP
jgi:hypothetical protein